MSDMKPIAVILASVVLSAGAAALTVKLLDTSRAGEQPPPTEQLREKLQHQENEIANLKKEIADAKNRQPAVAAPAGARISGSEIDDAIARWMAAHAGELGAAGASKVAVEGAVTPKKGERATQVTAFLAALRDKQKPYEERRQVWAQIKEAGLMDEVIASIEQNAKDNAGSADAQCELAHAYFEKLQTVTDGPEKGKWAMMADNNLDKALELNPNHWDARFSKAVGLSFWPPIFGKQAEAVSQFEILKKQQEESGATKPEFAQTYLFLGNMYQQQGKSDKAVETWQKGVSMFPDNADMKKLLAGASGKK
jgi:tetratricopeptide (TPR) repeat protein